MTCNEARCPFICTHDEFRTALNFRVVGDDDEDRVALKKRKAVDGSATKRKRRATDAFADRRVSSNEEKTLLLILYEFTRCSRRQNT